MNDLSKKGENPRQPSIIFPKTRPVDILVVIGILNSSGLSIARKLILYSVNRVDFLEEQKLKRHFQQKDFVIGRSLETNAESTMVLYVMRQLLKHRKSGPCIKK